MFITKKVIPDKVSIEEQSKKLIEKLESEGIENIWSRFEKQQPQCGFGLLGLCCRNCLIGPCRIDPFELTIEKTSCGCDADTIVARNLLRSIASGTSSQLDLLLEILRFFEAVISGRCKDLEIVAKDKLIELAKEFEIVTEGKNEIEIGKELLNKIHYELSKFVDEELKLVYIPKDRVEIWKKFGIYPFGVMREVIEAFHKTHEGVDTNPESLLKTCFKLGILVLWFISQISYIIQDVLTGIPIPRKGPMGFQTLSEDFVNIVIRIAKRPLIKRLIEITRDKEVEEKLKQVGAYGINILAPANFIMSELVIATGLVDAFVVDYLCVMPSVIDVASKYHTRVITTSPIARMRNAIHIDVKPENLNEACKRIIEIAIEAFKNRKSEKIYIPEIPPSPTYMTFSIESFVNHIGGDIMNLINALKTGEVKGIGIVFGCTNPKIIQHKGHVEITKELIKNNIIVFGTGCWNIAAGYAGLLRPEAADLAGNSLKEFCKRYKIPPCISFGTCADNARILRLIHLISEKSEIEIGKLPVIASAPELMAEEILTMVFGFIASGIPTHVGVIPPILGSTYVTKFLTEEIEKYLNAKLIIEPNPEKASKILIEIVMNRRKEIGWS